MLASQIRASSGITKKVNEMRDEYNFKGGVRGKYAKRFAEGTNLVLLEPDVAKQFPDSQSVNNALRELMERRAKGGSGPHLHD